MLGAIIGDIVGSSYEVKEVMAKKLGNSKRGYAERVRILDKKVPLFTEESCYTDDTVLTIAIADSLLHDKTYEESLREWGVKEQQLGTDHWGRNRFGKGFTEWLEGNSQGKSFGNGAAMRVSPVGYFFDELIEVERQARLTALPTHNHAESVTAAVAVASTIFLARNGVSKEEISYYLSLRFHYRLNYDLHKLQEENTFTSSANVSVPQALYCFMIANDFEDGIRKAISIGGDSDTIAAITGSILEAYYGVPEELKEKALTYLNSEQLKILDDFYVKEKNKEKTINDERNRRLANKE